jgi:hypothetical protein
MSCHSERDAKNLSRCEASWRIQMNHYGVEHMRDTELSACEKTDRNRIHIDVPAMSVLIVGRITGS